MAIKRWTPSQIVRRQEAFILKRLKRNGKLYAFLRMPRNRCTDPTLQATCSGGKMPMSRSTSGEFGRAPGMRWAWRDAPDLGYVVATAAVASGALRHGK